MTQLQMLYSSWLDQDLAGWIKVFIFGLVVLLFTKHKEIQKSVNPTGPQKGLIRAKKGWGDIVLLH